MNRKHTFALYCLLAAGMVYAVLSFGALPAAACTPSQCSALNANVVNNFCYLHGCVVGGELVSCDSSGWVIDCYCGQEYTGQCS